MPDNQKYYPATKAQVDTLISIVNDFDEKVTPVNLSTVEPLVLDFVNDDITIIHGGLDTFSRRISN